MAKIAQIAAKYIIHATIYIEGIVDKPDVIGAVFGQTEGLLGADLELRELQKSGRIGRIEVNVDTKGGKTSGDILIPSSLDKAETSIVGAAIEIIQRIGPCNAKIQVKKIEDIRISKRQAVISRAKTLLKDLMDTSIPDSQELSDEVASSVRMMEIQDFGREKLAAGPMLEEGDDIIVVEGRADVLTLLKHGFKNAIAMNGTSVPQTIQQLSKEKEVTVFVDGDRGGDLIIQELLATCEIDYITKAPDGKEVEELTKKELHKALRGKVATEQYVMEHGSRGNNSNGNTNNNYKKNDRYDRNKKTDNNRQRTTNNQTFQQKPPIPRGSKEASDVERKKFQGMLEDLIGTRGAYILDQKLNILGKVPVTELQSTIKSLGTGIYAIVFDGNADKGIVETSEKSGVKFIIAMDSETDEPAGIKIYTTSTIQ